MGIMISIDTKELSRREVKQVVIKIARVLGDEYGEQLKYAILDSALRKKILTETSGGFLDEEDQGGKEMKDLDWLKEEVRNCEYITEHDIRRLSGLIDEVEQSTLPKLIGLEQLKGKLIKERDKSAMHEPMYHFVDEIIADLNKVTLEQPALPKIPEFVAEFVEENQKIANHWFETYDVLLAEKNTGHISAKDKKVYNYIVSRPDKYVDAYRFGYTIEEKKHYARIKGADQHFARDNPTYLKREVKDKGYELVYLKDDADLMTKEEWKKKGVTEKVVDFEKENEK